MDFSSRGYVTHPFSVFFLFFLNILHWDFNPGAKMLVILRNTDFETIMNIVLYFIQLKCLSVSNGLGIE